MSFQDAALAPILHDLFILGEDGMGLFNRLLDKDLTLQCPSCRAKLVRKGSWVKSVAIFTCERCGEKVRLSYSEKLEIFRRGAFN
ncbi:hypothetical protein C7I87_11150 [Mesorhizobium sp. SARCC-RB16n]|nr:hypothetical protein C7I87_11150 [Mesorhizobium sp. SARCC-RB16n]